MVSWLLFVRADKALRRISNRVSVLLQLGLPFLLMLPLLLLFLVLLLLLMSLSLLLLLLLLFWPGEDEGIDSKRSLVSKLQPSWGTQRIGAVRRISQRQPGRFTS
jgi:hypothetical protein